MRIRIRYFDGCPHVRVMLERIDAALDAVGLGDTVIEYERVESADDAQAIGFRGSPTVLVDGEDPFFDPAAPVGLVCRIYRTPAGSDGAPTVAQLRAAFDGHRLTS